MSTHTCPSSSIRGCITPAAYQKSRCSAASRQPEAKAVRRNCPLHSRTQPQMLELRITSGLIVSSQLGRWNSSCLRACFFLEKDNVYKIDVACVADQN